MDKTVHHTHVCLGGHLDGQRYAPSKDEMLGPLRFRLRKCLSEAMPTMMLPAMNTVRHTDIDEIYEAESIKLHHNGQVVEYFFWRVRGIALPTAIAMLLEGYLGKTDVGQ